MRAADFERLVEEAIASIPEDFRRRMENIAIVIEEEPDEADLDELEIEIDDESELLGIFRGVALTEMSYDQLPGLPNQVAIFRGPILRCCSTRQEAIREIRETVIHELGHYFGLSDEEMPF
jgi:predicted Zn-dependent protease with MMP-like domain